MNVSSIVDLKAELFRKQEELKRQKTVSNDGNYIKGKTTKTTKTSIWSKKNAGVLERAQRDIEEKEEEENIFDKSKKALEAKAQLYDKICKSSEIPDEDGSVTYLVDFQKKVIDNIVEKRNKDKAESVEKSQEEPPIENNSVPPEEEWVDYVDSLGRSRRCMKKDLHELKKRDEEFTGKPRTNTSTDSDTAPKTDMPTLMSSDMKRELLRQKWEKEEEESRNQPIHYSNVRYDEVRSHGVGYYQFSRSEEARQKEMETLGKLREQTLDERTRRERLKEKRKAMLSARLAKVKQRRTMKGGLLGLEGDDKSEEEIGPKLEEILVQTEVKEKAVVEPLTRDDSWRKDQPVREWDKGKETLPMFSAEKYSQERREERVEEFAPPSFYKEESTSKQSFKTTVNKSKYPQSKQTVSQPLKHDDISLTAKPVTSPDISNIPLPPEVGKPSSNEEIHTNSELKPQAYGQGSTEPPHNYGGYPMADSSLGVSQHAPSAYHGQDTLLNYNPQVPPPVPGTYTQHSSFNYSSGAAQLPAGTYPVPGVYNTGHPSDWRPGSSSQPCGYVPTQGNTWTVPASSAIDPNTQAVNSTIAGGVTQQAAYGHYVSNVGPIPAVSSNACPETSTVSSSSIGLIPGVSSVSSSSTDPTPSLSSVTSTVSQNKAEHVPRIPKMSIVDSRFIQNEAESEPVGNEFLPNTNVEAVAYEPGSFTEVMSQTEGEAPHPSAAPGQSNYSGGAVLYTQAADSSTEHTTEDAVNRFLRHIRKETLK